MERNTEYGLGSFKNVEAVRKSQKRLRIVFAEDDYISRLVALRIFERLGHTVQFAVDGKEAVEMASRCDFDMAFLDLNMPIMDGFEAARRIRDNELDDEHLPIVGVTALAFNEDMQRCVDAGMDGFLSKPIRVEQLQDIVERFSPENPVEAVSEVFSSPDNQVEEVAEFSPFDMDAVFKETHADQGLLKSVAMIFVRESSAVMLKIRGYLEEGDCEAVVEPVHLLKERLKLFGVVSAADSAQRLEESASNGELDQVVEDFIILSGEVERFRRSLSDFLKKEAS